MSKIKTGLAVAAVIFAAAAGLIYSSSRNREETSFVVSLPSAAESKTAAGTASAAAGTVPAADDAAAGAQSGTPEVLLAVHVCGAVMQEGVYYLPAGSLVCDALQAAGGFRGDADHDVLNLAQEIRPGEQIRVPTITEAFSVRQAESDAAAGLVNINTADKTELMTLPGIGEVRAEAIVAYRRSHGAFAAVKDILQVTGIRESIYEDIKDKITVGG